MFLNLSHHPSSAWGHAQIQAARTLDGDLQDRLFPEVAPDAVTEEVASLGAAVAEAAILLRPTAVLVQGEFTLTYSIVAILQSAGIPCYAATTRRVIEEQTRLDGVTERLSRFEFVQLRRYPEIECRHT